MEQIKDIVEILELAKEEIESNNENITATLDLQDLKSLKNLYDLYNKEKALNEELQIRYKIENDKYNKEKEKNKQLKKENQTQRSQLNSAFNNGFIHKEQIKEYLNKMEKRCDKPKFSIMKKEIEELLKGE